MIEIKLTKGYFARIDDIDKDLSNVSWYASSTGYAARTVNSEFGIQKMIYLHRVVLERKIGRTLLKSEISDHINHDIADCSRNNLRVASYSQSVHNTRKNSGTAYKGVCHTKKDGRWRSKIMSNRVQHFVGSFETAEEAARAYDYHAIKYHGEYASLNFPNEVEKTVEWFESYVPPAYHSGSNEFRGVWKNGNKWSARITVNGKRTYLGAFDTPQMAHDAFSDAYRNSKR